jgi:hypothetical protein
MKSISIFSDIYDRTLGRIERDADSYTVENGFSDSTSEFAASLLQHEDAHACADALEARYQQSLKA